MNKKDIYEYHLKCKQFKKKITEFTDDGINSFIDIFKALEKEFNLSNKESDVTSDHRNNDQLSKPIIPNSALEKQETTTVKSEINNENKKSKEEEKSTTESGIKQESSNPSSQVDEKQSNNRKVKDDETAKKTQLDSGNKTATNGSDKHQKEPETSKNDKNKGSNNDTTRKDFSQMTSIGMVPTLKTNEDLNHQINLDNIPATAVVRTIESYLVDLKVEGDKLLKDIVFQN